MYLRQTSPLNTVALIGVLLMCSAIPITAQGPELARSMTQHADAGEILFGSQGNFWVIAPDGSGLKKITSATPDDPRFSASWSPDGNRLAFVTYRLFDGSNGQFKSLNVWIMNADGSGLKPITGDPKRTFYDVTWSPDGQKLAATCALVEISKEAGVIYSGANVCIVNADGSGVVPVTRLTNNHTVIENIVWSPDGRKIAFLSNRLLDSSENEKPLDLLSFRNIWIMDPDGSHALPLTHFTQNHLRITSLAWSPDSRTLAYISNRALDGSPSAARGDNLWLMHADGSGSSPLTRFNQADCRSFSWSPDGSRLAFASNVPLDGSDHAGAPSNIWVMKSDGSAAVPLTSATTLTSRSDLPVWSPGGSSIAFASCTYISNLKPSSECNLWIMKEDGSAARALTSDGKSGEAFLWRP